KGVIGRDYSGSDNRSALEARDTLHGLGGRIAIRRDRVGKSGMAATAARKTACNLRLTGRIRAGNAARREINRAGEGGRSTKAHLARRGRYNAASGGNV